MKVTIYRGSGPCTDSEVELDLPDGAEGQAALEWVAETLAAVNLVSNNVEGWYYVNPRTGVHVLPTSSNG